MPVVAVCVVSDVLLITVGVAGAVQRFGLIPGRGPGEQRWSAYNVLHRVSPDELVAQTMSEMLGAADGKARQNKANPLSRITAHTVQNMTALFASAPKAAAAQTAKAGSLSFEQRATLERLEAEPNSTQWFEVVADARADT